MLTCKTCGREAVRSTKDKVYPNRPDPLCPKCRQKYIRSELGVYERYVHMIRYSKGITEEQLREMMDQQRGACAICEIDLYAPDLKEERSCNVDHCHESGTVRGLLCTKCNVAIGMFKDNIDLLYAAISYLSRKSL